MICTLYSHKTGFKKLTNILKKEISKGKFSFSQQDDFKVIEVEIKGGFFSSRSKLKISYREKKDLGYQISEKEDCPLNENVKGLYGFVTSLPSMNEDVKNLFLQKIQTVNSEFSIIQEEGITKNLDKIINKIAQMFDAFLFAQENTVISKSIGQHFLDKNLDLIIDQYGNCKISKLEVNINPEYFDEPQIEITKDQKERKVSSENIIKNKSIKVNKNLPFIESEKETTLRTVKEIAERVTILTITNQVAFNNMEGNQAIEYLKNYNLWELVTPNEKIFLENPTDERKNQETWKCEGIWVLMWSLKIINELDFPDKMADLGLIPSEKYPIGEDKDPNIFIGSQKEIRTKNEILNMNDLYYRMDWACVDGRINQKQLAEINCGVVYERHYALNWLINYMEEDWDDISCDT